MTASSGIKWQWCAYGALSRDDLFAILKLRQEVFIIEQQCIYPDIDEADRSAYHLLGWFDHAEEEQIGDLAAYLRVLPPETVGGQPAIGRVIIASAYRGQALGTTLMKVGINKTQATFPGKAIVISAQAHLQKFYQQLGFVVTSDVYDEDGIDHIDMVLPVKES